MKTLVQNPKFDDRDAKEIRMFKTEGSRLSLAHRGGTSTGGVYAVSGTIGQPDAGPTMTNGQYAVTGGFWVMPQALQTEGAPTLLITKGSPGFAYISWTPASTIWVLQETLSLSRATWTNSPAAPPIPSSSRPRCRPSSIASTNHETLSRNTKAPSPRGRQFSCWRS